MIGFVKNKKSWLFITTCFVIFIQLFGLLLMPLPAKAVPSEVTIDAPAEVKDVKKTIGATILSTAMGGLMNAFSYFMRKLAYDSAMYLASGGKGQGALAFKDGFGSYMKNVALDSVATMVEEIGKPFGLNLCQTPDLNFQVYLQIGIRNMYVNAEGGQGPQPSCTFQQLKSSWSAEAFAQKYGSAEGMMEKAFNNAIRVENSDFGIAYGAMAQVDRNKVKKEDGAKSQRLEGGGFKAATGLIDNKIKTPAKVVEEETMSVTNKGQSQMTAGQVAGVYGSGMLQVIPQALSVFLNTFISQGLKTVMGLLTGDDSGGGGSDYEAGVVSFDSAAIVSNRQKAHAAFSQLLTIKLNGAQNYSILEEMSLCPSLDDPSVIMGPDHCVIDADLKMALDRAKMGSPLTIEQAIKENLLHGEWILVSPKRIADNTSPSCAQGKYCYSNIQKLRRNRVLPLGFEIAAYYADPDEPEKDKKWTLKTVMDGFSNCNYVLDDKGNKVVDQQTGQPKVIPDTENYPYCHLIDPNWVLKAPTAQCSAMAYGPTLQDAQTGVRAQYCADLRTCLKEEPGKACDANQYGYCTREKNVWRFAGDSCDKVYNTCTGYFSREGDLNYFLARTLDYGECAMDSVGCRGYSATRNVDGAWLPTFSAGGLEYKKEGINQAYYFNEKIKTDSCGQSDEGCSEFYLSELQDNKYQKNYTDDNRRFVKKAPDYLHCYDTDLASIKTDWPQTKPELAKLKSDKRCSEFAQACLPEEVDCDLYTPQFGKGNEPIPAKIGEEQMCDQSCVGYDALEQEATNFEYSVFPLYFIPTNGKECSETFKGCDEFTNIDELAKGGEGLEYFYDLRYCEKSDGKNETAYYSWEGSDTEGYVLKIHKLRPYTEQDFNYISKLGLSASINVAEVFPAGSPAYSSDDKKFLEDEHLFCNKEGYSKLILGENTINGAANEDCRALYDKSGKVYYRLLADTVEVSDACHPLRKTKSTYWEDVTLANDKIGCEAKNGRWEGSDAVGSCQRCLRGGFYEKDKDACVYWTTGAYGSCSEDMNGCRKYTGNQGNDIESIVTLSFEPQGKDDDAINEAKDGWSPANSVSIVAEALQVSLHSLQIKGGAVGYELPAGAMSKGSLYILSFWARGENIKLGVNLKQGATNAGSFTFDLAKSIMTTSSVSYDWREYHLGPVTFTGESSVSTTLEFQAVPVGKIYFLDNLKLSRLNDTYYLIRDSWKTTEGYQVPKICDEFPEDPYPGKALGCRAYTQDSTGLPVYATGFENLCREEAVGCRAVYDTYNTEESNLNLYNVWCAVTSTPQNGKCVKSITVEDVKETRECDVPQNAKGCFIDKIVVPDGTSSAVWSSWVVSSTIVLPADTSTGSPLYLTVHKNFQCTENKLGCQNFGLEDKILPTVVSSTEAYLLNNPAKYIGPDGTLCRNDLVGCEEFKAGNDVVFFKEPKLVGNTLCEYKSASQGSGISLSGWFQKDVGYCYDPDDKWTDKLCRSANDCGKDYSCKDIGTAPCYQNYLLPGGEYGIWSNGNAKYAGMVGICPEDANNCRELIDPMDKDKSNLNDLGRAYYVIFDQKLLSGLSECEGQISWKKGCVLFNKTDQPNLLYDATATYNNSSKSTPPHGLVSPSSSAKNDANTIIKVTRDRECGEWLACRGSLPIPDSQSQSGERYACYALQPCKDGTNFNCTEEVSKDDYGSGEILDYDKYVTRDVSWFTGREYVGYSLFNKYPMIDLGFVDLDKEEAGGSENKKVLGFVNHNQTCVGVKSGTECGNGVCYGGQCIVAPDGVLPEAVKNETAEWAKASVFSKLLPNSSCRAYPSQDSPFTDFVKTIVQSWVNNRPVVTDDKYTNSSICQQNQNCDCNYTKVGYGQSGGVSETRYYSYGTLADEVKMGGICQGGANDGKACAVKEDCDKDPNLGAICLRQQQKSSQIGWNGYCLEQDISRRVNNRKDNTKDGFACLTWYPLDYAPGLFDIYYNDPGKGYVPPADAGNPGQLYCLEMLGTGDVSIGPAEGDTQSCTTALFNNINYCVLFKDFCDDTGLLYAPDDCSDQWDFKKNTEGEYVFWDSLYGKVKSITWKLLDSINPLHGLGTKDNHNYHYISRIDVGVNPNAKHKLNDSANGTSFSNTFGDDNSPLDMLRKTWSQLAGGFMATAKGNGVQEYAVPLFPDVENTESSWIYKNDGSWPLIEGGLAAGVPETQHDSASDSGIIRHAPNRTERFLEKSMIYAVSIIPIAVSENGDDGGVGMEDIPALGYPLTIYLDKDYPKEGTTASPSDLDMKRSGAGSCPFCKYWVMKTSNSDTEEGYLIQWQKSDPVLGNGDDAQPYEVYANADSYLVNPLRFSDGGENQWDKPSVKCIEDGTGGHFIAVEIRFNKKTGEFLGYRSRNCNQLPSQKEFGYATAVVFTLQPMCVEAVKVYSDDASEKASSKAYTDNIWEGRNFTDVYKSSCKNCAYVDMKLEYNLSASPFGSARFSGDLTDKLQNPWFRIYPDPQEDEMNAGMPRYCQSDFRAKGGDDILIKYASGCYQSGNFKDMQLGYNPDAFEEQKKNFNTADEEKYAFFDHLFAKAFSVYSRMNNLELLDIGKEELATKSNLFSGKVEFTGGDKSFTNGKPPYIYPAVDCVGEVCELDKKQAKNEYGFSVNGIVGKKADDALFGVRNKAITARFYTWADHNQMPLRRIMIDWQEQEDPDGLGTVAGDILGYYSNYKPFCKDGGDAKECVKKNNNKPDLTTYFGLTCSNNYECPSDYPFCVEVGAHFGNQSGVTCVDRPAQRFFNYSCDADKYKKVYTNKNEKIVKEIPQYVYRVDEIDSDVTFDVDGWQDLLVKKGQKLDSLVCVYQPRLNVLDNWGWCSGKCKNSTADPTRMGCYNGGGINDMCEEYGPNDKRFLPYSNIIVVAP